MPRPVVGIALSALMGYGGRIIPINTAGSFFYLEYEDIAMPASASPVPGASCAGVNKEEINSLPIGAYEGRVVLIRSEEELDAALPLLRAETLLGFDTETRPNFSRGAQSSPALIQLACADAVFLIHLVHVPFSEKMASLLADEAIVKAGVAIRDDMRALAKLYSFEPAGITDLAALARARGLKAQGLRTLTAALLGFRISKSAQCSNWEHPNLTPRQIKYAATDAWVGRELYLALNSGYKNSDLR